jgi:hypothetical protein
MMGIDISECETCEDDDDGWSAVITSCADLNK